MLLFELHLLLSQLLHARPLLCEALVEIKIARRFALQHVVGLGADEGHRGVSAIKLQLLLERLAEKLLGGLVIDGPLNGRGDPLVEQVGKIEVGISKNS